MTTFDWAVTMIGLPLFAMDLLAIMKAIDVPFIWSLIAYCTMVTLC
jgi:hypothetical protein